MGDDDGTQDIHVQIRWHRSVFPIYTDGIIVFYSLSA